jgi:outer membrane receptor protein involved in Fe transport
MTVAYGFRLARYSAALAAFFLTVVLAPAAAQTSAAGSISGTVTASSGGPVAGAAVNLTGVVSRSTTTDTHGAYSFDQVPLGVYQVVVTKAGYFQSFLSVAIVAGANVTSNVTLQVQSFTSLRTIAHVGTNAPGYAPINQSTESINTITSQQFLDQGQIQVSKILNETPGIISWGAATANNGADEGTPQTVQIRGALPYETETLIDGHPTPLSITGNFNPLYLNPALLQSVEIVKGPGSMPSEINYAIGGTANFITLEPTLTPQATLIAGVDRWGGVNTAIRFTGSTDNRIVQWAFGYATIGTPGPLNNYPIDGSVINMIDSTLFSWKMDGKYMAFIPEVAGLDLKTLHVAGIGGIQFTDPVYVCCDYLNTGYNNKAELGKIRLNFSGSTSLTLSYLGGQAFTDWGGVMATDVQPVANVNQSFSVFAPNPGYTGSVTAGTAIPFELEAFVPDYETVQQNLYQAEFRTTFGDWTALARYFYGGSNDLVYLATGPGGAYGFTGQAWGNVPLCPTGQNWNEFTDAFFPNCSGGSPPVMTNFNGQRIHFSDTGFIATTFEYDQLRGGSFELDRPFDNGSNLTLSFDRSFHSAYQFFYEPVVSTLPFYGLAPGAGQSFTTESLVYGLFPVPKVELKVADYFIQYSSHFTDNGGGVGKTTGPASWKDASQGYNAPRLGLTWQPDDDTSMRFALGASIAPPYLTLLSSPGAIPTPNISGAPTFYTLNLNNGNILPETSWGYDLGIDHRFMRSFFVSGDVYLTNLTDMYLPETYFDGTYAGLPLYATQTKNLAHARYEGVELDIGDVPATGLGFRIEADLMRAYAYDLPPGFYCADVPANMCTPAHYNANLGVIPGINWTASGAGFNTVNADAVPYAMGYGELNYRTAWGTYFNLGATYYGNNNAYSRPAFFVVSAAIREPVRPGTELELSADNLLNVYPDAWTNYFGGVPSPLAAPAPDGLGLPVAGVGPTDGGNYGPTTFRFQIIQNIGGGR